MKKFPFFFASLFLLFFFSGCTSTFAGTLFVLNFRDIILYVGLAFLFAGIIGLSSTNKRKGFWTWFILGLVLTPLASFIYMLVKLTGKKS